MNKSIKIRKNAHSISINFPAGSVKLFGWTKDLIAIETEKKENKESITKCLDYCLAEIAQLDGNLGMVADMFAEQLPNYLKDFDKTESYNIGEKVKITQTFQNLISKGDIVEIKKVNAKTVDVLVNHQLLNLPKIFVTKR